MRTLDRPDVAVPALSKREPPDVAPRTLPPRWQAPDVRGLLHAMQVHICAYCCMEERTLDVEHFRPKSVYWWLAYEASNLFLGCTGCNQRCKGAEFPLTDEAARVSYETRQMLQDEPRVLFDPAADTGLEAWFRVDWDDATCRLEPASELSETEQHRVKQVVEFFHLNRDPIVRMRRSRAFEAATRAAAEGKWDEVRRMAMRHREHSLTACEVLSRANQAAPATDDELADRVRTLWRILREQVRELLRLKTLGVRPGERDAGLPLTYAWALIILSGTHGPLVDDILADQLGREPDENRTEILRLFRQIERATAS